MKTHKLISKGKSEHSDLWFKALKSQIREQIDITIRQDTKLDFFAFKLIVPLLDTLKNEEA
jgi:hypothetical protein